MKIGRKKQQDPIVEPATDEVEVEEAAAPASPRDISEVDVDGDGVTRVDLGGLLLAGVPGLEVRMQVDEKSRSVGSVVFAGPEGALEVRVFARSRNAAMWDEVRPQVAADAQRRGGAAREAEGRWGTELVLELPVKTEDGTAAKQPSRVVGVEGPRWFLRGSFLGRPAVDPAAAELYDQALAAIVVRRGAEPMAPGEPLPMTVPATARRMQRPAQQAD